MEEWRKTMEEREKACDDFFRPTCPQMVRLVYRGTEAQTEPLEFVRETDEHWIVRIQGAVGPIDARYRKDRWSIALVGGAGT